MKVNGYTIKPLANLWEADLRGADLREANLREANLWEANLREANLRGANLWEADLREADLWGADLRKADLRKADLQLANLRGADLRGANIWEADLREADLLGADLREADLREADLQGATLPYYEIFPKEGLFYAFKKFSEGVIGKVLVPKDAERVSSLVGRKGRVSNAILVELFNYDEEFVTSWNGKAEYRVGEIMIPDSFDSDKRVECTHGIHIFLTRQEAEDW